MAHVFRPRATAIKTLLASRRVRQLLIAVLAVAALVVPSGLAYFSVPRTNVLPADTLGNIYLQPARLSLQPGQPVEAALRIEPGTAIDTVTGTITYDASKLTYNGVSYAGSPFTTQVPATTTASSVTVQAAKFGGQTVNEDSLVARVTFTAKQVGDVELRLKGNAARAGTATYPRVNGVSVTPAIPGQNGTRATPAVSHTTQPASQSPAPPTSPVVTPIHSLLTTFGMSRAQANAVAPVLATSLALVVLAAGAVLVYTRILVPRRNRHRTVTATRQGDHDETVS